MMCPDHCSMVSRNTVVLEKVLGGTSSRNLVSQGMCHMSCVFCCMINPVGAAVSSGGQST